eukprot:TRINITY_DN5331_c0_g1_i6.p1 TRINITY_DN5331_c0_g1~~TRINITY_DN5331_c0_g1_i6.p1  ORF type:complete len:284 (+),score=98.57 TRINITY_DN5331_c0_g1_i6:262-1113(+)
MFSGFADKLKSSLGLPVKTPDPNPNPNGSYATATAEEPQQPEEEIPEEEIPEFIPSPEPDVPRQAIPGAALVNFVENRQQQLALRRRQIVMMAAKADDHMARAGTECRRHLEFVTTVDEELKQLPNLSATVLSIRSDLEKLVSDCHELELAFSEVSEAKVLLGLERWRDEQWDMMARFREAKKQEIQTLERKVQAKKDRVEQHKDKQAQQQTKQNRLAAAAAEASLPDSVTAALEEGASDTAGVILGKEMSKRSSEGEQGLAGSLPEQLTAFSEEEKEAQGRA